MPEKKNLMSKQLFPGDSFHLMLTELWVSESTLVSFVKSVKEKTEFRVKAKHKA